jgi:hypothetical protein
MNLPLYEYNDHDTFYSKSLLTKASNPMYILPLPLSGFVTNETSTLNQWTSFFTFIQSHGSSAPSPWNTIIDLYGGIGSQINTPSSSSAFSHRDSLWNIQNNANTADHNLPFDDASKDFIEGLTDSLVDMGKDDFGIYLNCADPELSAELVARKGYGVETYNTLLVIKRILDPDNVFWNPQSIGNVEFLGEDRGGRKMELSDDENRK